MAAEKQSDEELFKAWFEPSTEAFKQIVISFEERQKAFWERVNQISRQEMERAAIDCRLNSSGGDIN